MTNPHDVLKHHVTGAIERGEKEAIVEVRVLPAAAERLRVNMGWQCPECFGPNIQTPERQKHQCQNCGCLWDRHYYPSIKIV